MHDKIDALEEIIEVSEERIESLNFLVENVNNKKNMKRAFKGLKEVLREEKESIIKKVVQVEKGGLDKRY